MAEVGAASQELFAGLGKGLARIVAKNSGEKVGGVTLALTELAADGSFRAKDKVVEALGLAVQKRGEARLGAADGQTCQALAGLQKLIADGAVEAVGLLGEVLGDLVLGLGNQFGGG